jgi:hypothetical protein
VMRPGQRQPGRPIAQRERHGSQSHWFGGAFTVLALVGLGAYGYSQYKKQIAPEELPASVASLPASVPSSRTCDGRTMCSQMTSCAEATYFIRNCPNTQMDGDNDGVPCESQWCN